jgi:predicted transcriptional regulator
MAYVMKDIFGQTKRIDILEELVERWGEFLEASEISRMTDVSKKTVYTHLKQLEKIGMIETKEGKATKYRLKKDDKRALALSILESEEYLRRLDLAFQENNEYENLGYINPKEMDEISLEYEFLTSSNDNYLYNLEEEIII